MKVRELKGYAGIRAMWAYHSLMLGLKMLPAYMGETYEDFLGRVEKMPAESKIKLIREAALFVQLQKEEIDALVCFCEDPNGVPYTEHNVKNLSPAELMECIVCVAFQVSKIKIDMISEAEKKN